MGAFTAAGMFPLSVEQLFEERMTIHRNLEEWRRLGRRGEGTAALGPRPEPTLKDVRRECEPSPANEGEEVIELVGLCLWGHLLGQPRCERSRRPSRRHRVISGRGCVPGQYLTRTGGLERRRLLRRSIVRERWRHALPMVRAFIGASAKTAADGVGLSKQLAHHSLESIPGVRCPKYLCAGATR
jgi:hypothetical protein